jgi:hypothetical protein
MKVWVVAEANGEGQLHAVSSLAKARGVADGVVLAPAGVAKSAADAQKCTEVASAKPGAVVYCAINERGGAVAGIFATAAAAAARARQGDAPGAAGGELDVERLEVE